MNRRTVTIHGTEKTTVVELEEVSPEQWVVVSAIDTLHAPLTTPTAPTEERYADGRLVNPPPPLPPIIDPAYCDVLGEGQKRMAEIDKVKREAR